MSDGTARAFADRLREAGAHHDLVSWAESHPDPREAWRVCPRGDWMLAIAARFGAPRDRLVAAAVACARLAIDSMEEHREAGEHALAVAEGFACGAVDAETAHAAGLELERIAEVAGSQAECAALLSAAFAGRAAAEPECAVQVVAFLVESAVHDAGDCALLQAASWAQRRSADVVRAHLEWDEGWGV
jgi:hypothetical protein